MLKKRSKYLIATIVILLLGYNSIYFRSLQEVQAAEAAGKFDAATFSRTFWKEQLIPATEKAIEIKQLISLLQTEKEQTFENHSHALGIGNLRYFLVKGKGKTMEVNENEVVLSLNSGSEEFRMNIATEYVYGNAVRDALGTLKINDFSNTMDLNKVSEEINKKIRTDILPPFKSKVKAGDSVAFVGALELNRKYLNLENIEVIPVILTIAKE